MEKYHKTDICPIENENERDENYVGSNTCIDSSRTKNNYCAAFGLLATVVIAPCTLISRYLMRKFGPSEE